MIAEFSSLDKPAKCGYFAGMKNYIEPKTEELARLAAEALGCKCLNGWQPALTHDCAQVLVEYAFKRGIEQDYKMCLLRLDSKKFNAPNGFHMVLATPEQKTRAFLRAIHERKKINTYTKDQEKIK